MSKWACDECGDEFETFDDAGAHFRLEHPGKHVVIDFKDEAVDRVES